MKRVILTVCCILSIILLASCQKNYYQPDAADSSAASGEIRSIQFSESKVSMQIGNCLQLNPSVYPINEPIVYKSSDTSTATVNTSGIVFAKSKGNTTITAATKDGKVSAKLDLTVNDLRKMKISGSVPVRAKAGDQFTLTVTFENCTYPSVKIIADCGGGSIKAENAEFTFKNSVSQYQVIGKTVVAFKMASDQDISTIRIIGFDAGEMIDTKEYSIEKTAINS